MKRTLGVLTVLSLLLAIAGPAPARAASGDLLAGVGRADITPPTGFPLGGWTRADRVGRGVGTRLNASALVLQRGDRRVALVAMDLFMIPGGLLKEAAERNADLGFGEANVLVSASHTHAGPGGFANFNTFNTVAPSLGTIDRPETFGQFLMPTPPDAQLYTFLVDRLATAIRQAARNARPAAIGWGQTQLTGVTRNRSLEAHLADHGIVKARGQGAPEEDPGGALHTIDPAVDVLRVDRLVVRSARCGPRPKRLRGRRTCRRANRRRVVRVPIGAWTMFPNHGTVNPSEYQVYNNDHHASAVRVLEQRIRAAGPVSPKRMVVAVYGNGNEGDLSAGLTDRGPGAAERVGRLEADAMFAAWRQAGAAMSSRPDLDLRWTRTCFCGQDVGDGHRVASEPLPGLPFLTGSEEGRGPLYDITHIPLEDQRSPVEQPSQGHKLGIPGIATTDSVPKAAGLMAVRIADRVIATLPGEPTVEVGRRVQAAVLAAAGGAGVRRVIVSGLTNEYLHYLTTPEEYERQHYEGGSTIYGPFASVLLTRELGELAARMASGRPAQDPYPFDPRNGVKADAPPYGAGAETASVVAQPAKVAPRFRWAGGPRGLDRPLDTPFVTIERRDGDGWRRQTDDLWLDVVWEVDDQGVHTATWTVPAGTPEGTYRFVVTANRYRLVSGAFSAGGPARRG